MKTILSILTLALLGACVTSSVGLDGGFNDALNASARPADDKQRDASRQPQAVLEFVGIHSGMTVLDIAASTGWYTEVHAAAVGPTGRVIAQNSERRRDRSEAAITNKATRLPNVTVLYSGDDGMGLDSEVDAAWTALNLHDFHNRNPEAAQAFLKDVRKALKPGGVLGVIDHEGSAGNDNAALHRIETSVAVAAIEQAGFVVEAVSDILDNPADDHSLHMRDPSFNRNTDRFVIRARKPN